MLITAITHASVRDDDYNFRGLTEAGIAESEQAAAHYRDLTAARAVPTITRVVSSPKPRCLETVIRFAKALPNEALSATVVEVDAGLKAGDIEGNELFQIATEVDNETHILVAGHADFAKTLPASAHLIESAVSDGWFQCRPVLFHLQLATDQPWEQAQVHFCEGLVEGTWRRLLHPE